MNSKKESVKRPSKHKDFNKSVKKPTKLRESPTSKNGNELRLRRHSRQPYRPVRTKKESRSLKKILRENKLRPKKQLPMPKESDRRLKKPSKKE